MVKVTYKLHRLVDELEKLIKLAEKFNQTMQIDTMDKCKHLQQIGKFCVYVYIY